MTKELKLSVVERLAAQGLTLDQIARSCNMNPSTLHRKKKRNQEIQEAIRRGQAKGIATISNKLFEQASEGNLGAIIFYLKARGGWSETQNLVLSGGEEPIKHEVTSESMKALPLEKLLELAQEGPPKKK